MIVHVLLERIKIKPDRRPTANNVQLVFTTTNMKDQHVKVVPLVHLVLRANHVVTTPLPVAQKECTPQLEKCVILVAQENILIKVDALSAKVVQTEIQAPLVLPPHPNATPPHATMLTHCPTMAALGTAHQQPSPRDLHAHLRALLVTRVQVNAVVSSA